MTLLAWNRRRRDSWLDDVERDRLRTAWRAASAGAGIGRSIPTVTGPTDVVPALLAIDLGPPTVLVARLLPGQLAEDVRAAGHRLAGHLGAVTVRVEPLGLDRVRVELLDRDPLTDPYGLTDALPGGRPLTTSDAAPLVLLGRDDGGRDVVLDWRHAPHGIAQGATRAGKSALLYALLLQLAPHAHVRVAGLDPTGLVARPLTGTRHGPWWASGTSDLTAHEDVLAALVDDMDRRIAALPQHRDALDPTADDPLTVVALEEWPGLLRAADVTDPKLAKRLRALVARLLSEGHKAGYRVLILAQRAEANVIGGFERAQAGLRVSFRVDGRDTVALLHPGTPPDIADAHIAADPGIALVPVPGRRLTRLRAPFVAYGDYALGVSDPG